MVRDHLSSVRIVVNSETGQVVQRIDYDAWGNITHLQNQDEFTDIGFAGGLYDTDTGLIRFGARDYDPEVGRWTAKDPILFAGGTTNLYEYVINDPVNNIDPDGLQVVGTYNLKGGILRLTDVNTGKSVALFAESGGDPFGDPIPAGDYEILEQAQNPDFFRLDPIDSNSRNDIHEPTGRSRFRLHKPGRTIGCIAALEQTSWQSAKKFILNTKTEQVQDNYTYPWYLFWKNYTSDKVMITKYGTLSVY